MAEFRISRRRLVTAGGAAALLGAGYALGEWDRAPSRTWERVDEERPITVYSGRDDTVNRQRRLLIAQWNEMHRAHQAEMVELPGVADHQYSVMHARLQAGDRDVDIVNLDVPWIAEFAEEGYLHELEGVDASGFLGPPFEAGVVGGATYALPFNSDVGMLYYRKDFLDEEALENLADWDSLRELIDSRLRGTDYEAGIAMQLADYEGFTVNVWEYLLANGVATADDGSIDFGEGSRARSVLKRLAEDLHLGFGEGDVQYRYIHPESLEFKEDGSLAAFQESRTPLLRHWPRAAGRLRSCAAEFEVGVVPMPGGVLGGQSLAVSAFSERKNVSTALIEFLTGPASQQLLFERGGFAATRPEPYFDAMARLENRNGTDEATPGDRDCGQSGEPGPRLEARQLHKALEGAGRRPGVERYTQFSQAFQELLHRELQESAQPDLDELDDDLRDAVEGR